MAEKFYWCLEHSNVEGEDGCKAADRLGPYPSRDEARSAMERVASRNEDWEEQDERWKDD